MLRPLARRTVRAALARPRLRALVASELKRLPKPAPAAGARPPVVLPAAFIDRHGVAHPLDSDHRDRLKPGWWTMVDPDAAPEPPSDAVLRKRVPGARRTVEETAALFGATTGTRLAGRILEVGCYDGATAFQLASLPGAQVVASDLARYYVLQRPAEPVEEAVVRQHRELAELRERARLAAGAPEDAVTFVEDDITASGLEPGTFDAIVSFEVLEHVDGARALAAMSRLLRPGGIGYHHYNPFFAINGGHALCTLDFPWGHARLDPGDVERYCRELRPSAAAQTLRFYTESLNRLTQADVRSAVDAADLELLELVSWNDRSLAPQLTGEILAEVRRTYPAARAEDLLATFATLVVRRPA